MTKLIVSDLHKEYPTRGEPLKVLRGISLELTAGTNLAIVGPSGSGKSTLLHILGTLDRPTSGTVTLDDNDPFELDDQELATYRNNNIGFIFQDHHLLPQMSVLENVLIPALADGKPGSDLRERALNLLERVGLSDRLHHRPSELSGGERERVAVARSLILSPSLLVADEPTGNLDRTNARQVAELLLDIQRTDNMMLVVVTHSGEIADMLDSKSEIDDGKLI
ncbi:MAG TPA: ATP-binding protein [Planctomycetaceae bacterium]|jgi:lipoprotein-releasing system ATP-binding protein|nr:ATP-binding protein [Rhodopirellula sp.]MCH2360089.1 ABC transporter ATP-binding protein [Pirellulales bacterium]HAL12884.1 ATP-binding protein [Planctomycetaceae bacterium]HCK71591.1 ATP-binding protein [Planctomycetaceae bacterium]HCP83980.1 ATP-binding protein [Planctomycetaceae bacterium]|tara:strand:- start:3713 stop:4381 length:669 start_codon:yes stop_codon:yes gene_type:complete